MPTSYTPNLNLNLPEVGSSRDTWGTLLNDNTTTLDSYVFMATPIGCVLDFAGSQVPSGWLAADGRLVSRLTYSDLFNVIGTAFGAGDGSTTFGLPNFIGRAGVGPGSMTDQAGVAGTFGFANYAGFLANYITQANLPAYNLVTDVQGSHAHGGATAPGANHNHATDAQGWHNHGGATTAGPDHTHTGYSDNIGSHYHNVYTPYGYGGGGGAGAFTTTGQGGFGAYTDYQGTHQHAIQTYGSSTGGFALGIYYDGTHSHNITYSGNLQLGIYTDGWHQHNVNLGGGGQPFVVLSPYVVVTKIIYAGTQAQLSALATAVLPQSSHAVTAEDQVAQLREELAELRALLLPALQRRVTHSPTRGVH